MINTLYNLFSYIVISILNKSLYTLNTSISQISQNSSIQKMNTPVASFQKKPKVQKQILMSTSKRINFDDLINDQNKNQQIKKKTVVTARKSFASMLKPEEIEVSTCNMSEVLTDTPNIETEIDDLNSNVESELVADVVNDTDVVDATEPIDSEASSAFESKSESESDSDLEVCQVREKCSQNQVMRTSQTKLTETPLSTSVMTDEMANDPNWMTIVTKPRKLKNSNSDETQQVVTEHSATNESEIKEVVNMAQNHRSTKRIVDVSKRVVNQDNELKHSRKYKTKAENTVKSEAKVVIKSQIENEIDDEVEIVFDRKIKPELLIVWETYIDSSGKTDTIYDFEKSARAQDVVFSFNFEKGTIRMRSKDQNVLTYYVTEYNMMIPKLEHRLANPLSTPKANSCYVYESKVNPKLFEIWETYIDPTGKDDIISYFEEDAYEDGVICDFDINLGTAKLRSPNRNMLTHYMNEFKRMISKLEYRLANPLPPPIAMPTKHENRKTNVTNTSRPMNMSKPTNMSKSTNMSKPENMSKPASVNRIDVMFSDKDFPDLI